MLRQDELWRRSNLIDSQFIRDVDNRDATVGSAVKCMLQGRMQESERDNHFSLLRIGLLEN